MTSRRHPTPLALTLAAVTGRGHIPYVSPAPPPLHHPARSFTQPHTPHGVTTPALNPHPGHGFTNRPTPHPLACPGPTPEEGSPVNRRRLPGPQHLPSRSPTGPISPLIPPPKWAEKDTISGTPQNP